MGRGEAGGQQLEKWFDAQEITGEGAHLKP